jgi:hypothetical protein
MDTVDPPTACPGCIVVDICISRVGDEPSAARSSPVGTICAASAPVGVDGMGPVGTGPVVVVPGTMVVVVVEVAAPDAEMATGDEPVWPWRGVEDTGATGTDVADGALAVAVVVVVADAATAGDVVDVGVVVDVVDVVDVVVVAGATST